MRILFILKHRENNWGDYSNTYLSSGLYNSVRFINNELIKHGYESKFVQVVDNNCIDREVYNYKPTHVIIEAYWVVPEKFSILTKLHPTVTWIIRNHSETPFISTEGIAIGWSKEYVKYKNVFVACNSPRALKDFKVFCDPKKILYLPNYYPVDVSVLGYLKEQFCPVTSSFIKQKRKMLNIGCFGAIRYLKNQLIQAVSAIEVADKLGVSLNFHINGSRVEGNSDNTLKNIRSLFKDSNHVLVEHGWLTHGEFVKLIKTMDVGLQVSFTETFNIVSADFVSQNIPMVVSSEVVWFSKDYIADFNSREDITAKIIKALKTYKPETVKWLLAEHVEENFSKWVDYLGPVKVAYAGSKGAF